MSKSLNVLGLKVPVQIKKRIVVGNMECYGVYRPHRKTIEIHSPRDKATLIHEAFHALCDRLGIGLDPMIEEILANAVELLITENFKVIQKK